MHPLAFLVANAVLMSAAQVLQKHRVSSGPARAAMAEGARGLRRGLSTLARDPLWLLGYGLMIAAAFAGVQALSMVDLSVAKSFSRVESLLVVLGGAALLGERMNGREWLGLALTLAGAVALAPSAGVESGRQVSHALHGALAGTCFALTAGVVAAQRAFPERLSRETGLALGGGILIGLGDALMKGATVAVRAQRGGFSAVDPGSLAALVGTFEFALAAVAFTAGLTAVQLAYAVGRVSVIGPLVGAASTLLPLLFGFAVLREDLSPLRAVAISGLLSGSALLALGAGAFTGVARPAPR